MECANRHCAFWHSGRCLLPKISLDERGCCQECLMPDPGEEIMDRLRSAVQKECGLNPPPRRGT